MANRYAVKAGNWSDVTVWDGGTTLPGAGDVVRPNTYTVTIDQDVSVGSLINNSSSPALSNGQFVVSTIASTRNITLTSGVTGSASNLPPLLVSAASGTLNLTGAVAGGGTLNSRAMDITGAATVNITGAVTGGVANAPGINITGAATVNITGAVTGGSAGTAYGINAGAAATITVSGAVTGGSASTAYGVHLNTGSTSAVVTAGSAIANVAPAILVNSVASTIIVNGAVTASTAAQAIYAGTTASMVIRVTGPITHASNNTAPIFALSWMVKAGKNIAYSLRDDSASPLGGAEVVTTNYVTNSPAPENVREGTTYGPGGTLTGTLAVPAASSVAAGVPVDATTGTATLSLEAVASLVGQQIAAAVTTPV